MSRVLRGRLIVCIAAVGLIAPAAVGTQGKSQDQLARADFRDGIGDGVKSDGKGDPYAGMVLVGGTFFFPTRGSEQTVPTRWLVLDFSNAVSGTCPGLDTRLLAYDGRDPAAFSPEDPNPCVDLVEVRFFADGAFKAGAVATPVRILIDGPDLVRLKDTFGTRWNAKFELDFVNPASITPFGPDTISIETVDPAADLWMLNYKTLKKETPLGRYKIPFQVTVVRLP